MKNCELFTSVAALHEAWAKREEFANGVSTEEQRRKYLPSSILEWACFWDADTALDPKLKPGTLVKLTGAKLTFYPEGSFGIVVRPRMGCLNVPITELDVTMSDGKVVKIDAKYLRPSELPEEVMQLARHQLMDEMKAACPLYGKEN